MTGLAIVTGATDGIGWVVARDLARQGHHVLVHGRNEGRANDAVDRLRVSLPDGRFTPVAVDLASLGQIADLVGRLRHADEPPTLLVNNAGVFTPNGLMSERRLSADGFELHWAVNYLAPFALTTGLAPLLDGATVLNVGSSAHHRAVFDWSDPESHVCWERMKAYARSKLALTVFTAEFAARHGSVHSVCVNPGYVDTKMVRQGNGGPALDVETGAANVLAPMSRPRLPSGSYVDQGDPAPAHPMAGRPRDRERLWELTLAQLARAGAPIPG
ncbi:SDR family NAD(P)-dependent oxidoreductase [Actinokineospora enzanensis]|uniref:SDR family NAD(P)-dependent oxidoreductase n=1 Tax=Actinokineospora enzanensis TaxID=155975 RepID=UPI0003774C73|nr:SDR family NAD(P)-dependent oxidoreductase [Actinokineospora enzanensis]